MADTPRGEPRLFAKCDREFQPTERYRMICEQCRGWGESIPESWMNGAQIAVRLPDTEGYTPTLKRKR